MHVSLLQRVRDGRRLFRVRSLPLRTLQDLILPVKPHLQIYLSTLQPFIPFHDGWIQSRTFSEISISPKAYNLKYALNSKPRRSLIIYWPPVD